MEFLFASTYVLFKKVSWTIFFLEAEKAVEVGISGYNQPSIFCISVFSVFLLRFQQKMRFRTSVAFESGELRTNITTRSLFFKVPDFDSRQIQFSLFSRSIEALKSPSPISPYLRLVLISCLDANSNKASFGKCCSTLPSPSKFLVLLTGNLRLAESRVR